MYTEMPQGVPMTYPFPYKTQDGDKGATDQNLVVDSLLVLGDAKVDGNFTVEGTSTFESSVEIKQDLKVAQVESKYYTATDPTKQYRTTASDLDFSINDTSPEIRFLNTSDQTNQSTVYAGRYIGTYGTFEGSSSSRLTTSQKNTNTNPNAVTGFSAENASGDQLDVLVTNSRVGAIRCASDAGLDIETSNAKRIRLATNNNTKVLVEEDRTFFSSKVDIGQTVLGIKTGLLTVDGFAEVTDTLSTPVAVIGTQVNVLGTSEGTNASITTNGGLKVAKTTETDLVKVNSVNDAISTTTGSIQTKGGLGVEKTIRAGSIESTPIGTTVPSSLVFTTGRATDTTESTSLTTGALTVAGGLGVAKTIRATSIEDTVIGSTVPSSIKFTTAIGVDTTETSDKTTGAMVLAGGLGVGKTVIANAIEATPIGVSTPAQLKFTTAIGTDTTDASSTITGAMVLAGGVGVAKTIVAGAVENTPIGTTTPSTIKCSTAQVMDETDSLSTSSGALQVKGGLGVAKNIVASGLENTPIGSSVPATIKMTTGEITNVLDSTSKTSGALIVAGGLGVAKNIYADGIQNTPIGNLIESTGKFSTGEFTSSIPSVSTGAGALVVSGGLGVGGKVNAQQVSATDGSFSTLSASTLNSSTSISTATVNCTTLNASTVFTPLFTLVGGGSWSPLVLNCASITTGAIGCGAIGALSLNATGNISGAIGSFAGLVGPIGFVSSAAGRFTSVQALDTTDSTSYGNGSITTAGGLGVQKTIRANAMEDTPIGASVPRTGNFTAITATEAVLTNVSIDNLGATTPGAAVFTTINNNTASGSALNAASIGATTPGTAVFTSLSNTDASGSNTNFASIGAATPGTGAFTTLTNTTAAGTTLNASSIGATTPGTAAFTTLTNTTAAGSSLNVASIGSTTPGTAVFTTLTNSTAAGSALNVASIGASTRGSGAFTTLTNNTAAGTTLNAASIGATTPGTGAFTTCSAQQFTTNNGIFQTAASTTDYTMLGTNSVDGVNNTRIVCSGFQRVGNNGGIDLYTTATGIHKFYRGSSIPNSELQAGRLTLSQTGIALIVQNTGQFGSVETSNFTLLAGGTPMVVNNTATFTGTVTAPSLITNGSPAFRYSVGTWTPTIANWNNNVNSVTYTTRTGRWSKLGQKVTIAAQITFSFTVTGLFEYSITGFPFAPATRTNHMGYSINLNGNSPTSPVYLDFGAGSTVCTVRNSSNAVIAGMNGSNQQIFFTFEYLTDA